MHDHAVRRTAHPRDRAGRVEMGSKGPTLVQTVLMRARLFCRLLCALLAVTATAHAAEHLRLAKEFDSARWGSSGCALEPFLPGADLGVAVFRGSPGGLTLRSDGTAAGTYVLSEASFARDGDGPVSEVAVLGGRAYWAARTADGGLVLRETDGTVEGTGVTMVLDESISPETPPHLAALAGRLLILGKYLGKDGVWLSDATPEGTHILAAAGGFAPPVVTGRLAFFTADNPGHGQLVWVTDGTSAGTHPLVQSFCANGCVATAGISVAAGGLVYFRAGDYLRTLELWRSDGTTEGTYRLFDAYPSGTVGGPRPIWPAGAGVAFFLKGSGGSSQLWVSDGTRAGTTRLCDFADEVEDYPVSANGIFGGVAAFTGSALLFVADDGVHGPELWTTDGTQDGTHLVRDIEPGEFGAGGTFLAVSPGAALLSIDDGVHGAELWRSDGTSAGTFMLADICPGECSSSPANAVVLGNTVLFSAEVRSPDLTLGRELWKADLVTGRTELVVEICQGGCSSLGWSPFIVAGGAAVFFAMSNDGYCRLWSSDGTSAGTVPLSDSAQRPAFPDGETVGPLLNVNGQLLFTTGVYPWQETWTSDPATGGIVRSAAQLLSSSWTVSADRLFSVTSPGTVPTPSLVVTDIVDGSSRYLAGCGSGASAVCPSVLQPYHGGVLFKSYDPVHGGELWASDGSASGTGMVKDVLPGMASSEPTQFGRTRDAVFFSAGVGGQVSDLWKSDATAEGTQLVSPGLKPAGFVSAGDRVYFVSYRLVGGTLRVSDGSTAGTVSLPGKEPSEMTPFHGGLLFVGRSLSGYELWRTDGTSDGTALVKDILPGASSSNPSGLTAAGPRAFFAAASQTGNAELWMTDGSSGGTVLVKEIGPGLSASNPRSMVAVDDVVYFVASDREHGAEIWRSDGTPEGTAMVEDLCLGACSSMPEALTRVGSTIYFTADDWVHGKGLWALDLDLVEASAIDAGVGPGEAVAAVPIELSGTPDRQVTLGFETEDGTARAGTDYVRTSGTLMVASGSRTVAPITVGVTVRNHGDPEKWFLVHVTELSGATVRRSTARVTLRDELPWRRARRHLRSGS